MPTLATHAPPRLLAKQWSQAYQAAPIFVAPLVLSGIFSNAALAWLTAASPLRASSLYALAAITTASIIPYTALYMEPGINGSAKWKAQELLRGEGVKLKGVGRGIGNDSASARSKRWAESVEMKTIVEMWARTNAWRYVITIVAAVLSATATVIGGRQGRT